MNINDDVYIIAFNGVSYIYNRSENKYKKQINTLNKCGIIEESSKEEFDAAIEKISNYYKLRVL